jgi:hypothetical protein
MRPKWNRANFCIFGDTSITEQTSTGFAQSLF